jgi:hypothetical protein
MKDTLNGVLARFGGLSAKHHPLSPAMEADMLSCIHSAYRAGVSSAEDDTDLDDELDGELERSQGRPVSAPINVRKLVQAVGETRAAQTLVKNMRSMDCPAELADRAARGVIAREMRAENNANTDRLNRERAAALAKTI